MPGFSLACKDLVGSTFNDGKLVAEALPLGYREGEHLAVVVEQVFEDILGDEVTLGQLPDRIHLNDRVLALKGQVIRTDEDEVEALLLTITDASELERAEKRAELNETLVRIIGNKEAFGNYLGYFKEASQQMREAFLTQKMEKVRGILHTLKGDSYAYGLTDIGNYIHSIEDKKGLHEKHLLVLSEKMEAFLRENGELLKLAYENLESDLEGSIEIDEDHLGRLREATSELSNPESIKEKVLSWISDVKRKPSGRLLGPLEEIVRISAKKLGKSIDFELVGSDVLIDSDRLAPVARVLPHILRNAVDHGIEYPEDRGKKPGNGKIEMSVSHDEKGATVLMIRDDGRGINSEKVVEKAIEKKIITPDFAKDLKKKDKLRLIFAEKLSTATRVTETSGRGIGMSAVRDVIEDLSGSIDIDSEYGEGATITITIPAA